MAATRRRRPGAVATWERSSLSPAESRFLAEIGPDKAIGLPACAQPRQKCLLGQVVGSLGVRRRIGNTLKYKPLPAAVQKIFKLTGWSHCGAFVTRTWLLRTKLSTATVDSPSGPIKNRRIDLTAIGRISNIYRGPIPFYPISFRTGTSFVLQTSGVKGPICL